MKQNWIKSLNGRLNYRNCLSRWILLWGVLLVGLSATGQTVIPMPAICEQGEGCFKFRSSTWWYTNVAEDEAQYIGDVLQVLPTRIERSGKPLRTRMQFCIVTDSTRFSSSESYYLSVTPKRILVEALSGAGLYYGAQTLVQLLTIEGTLPVTDIKDEPRFPYRGMMLDVSRHFFSKEFVKKQIDALARYKINRLHLHLTDAAGWRLEIKKYPRLTEMAAWRTHAKWKDWWNGNRLYVSADDSSDKYGGYYTQEDIREIVDYAQQHYITIIPEIEMPSHSEEVLAAYPELSCVGKPYCNADFCVGKEETFRFLQDVLDEVMALFPSEYIHIGGDEAGKQAWKTCPACLKRMAEEQLSDVDELQRYLINRIGAYLNAHGRKLLGWDEILQGNFVPGSSMVMSWRGEQGGLAAVRAGSKAVMTPGAFCYIDSYQDAPPTQPEAIGGYLPLEKVYSYNPVPDSLTIVQAKRIEGVQCNLWTEYVPDSAHAEYMIYPRAMALAEVGWSIPQRKNWNGFHQRALQEVEYLKQAGYNPFELKKEVGHRPESLQPVKHLALHKPVQYVTPYSSAYPANGAETLTDGRRGDWTYNDGAWQGFISKGRLDVVVDMGQITDIESISADFLQVTGAEVYLPAFICIEASDDNRQFRELKQENRGVDMSRTYSFETVQWQGQARARYIRFKATASPQYGGWVFTDEIVVK